MDTAADVTAFDGLLANAQALSGLGDKAYLNAPAVSSSFTIGALKGTTQITVTVFAPAPTGGVSAFDTIGKQAVIDATVAMIAEALTRL